MTIELILFIAIVAVIINLATIWAIGRLTHDQREMTGRLWSRIHSLEMVLGYHDLVPMPWEMDEFDNNETKGFKREGNIVYLQQEE